MISSTLIEMNNDTKDNWDDWTQYRRSVGQVIKTVVERYGVHNGNLLLLGVGNGNDIPIEYLESTFESITIVDLDEAALDRFLLKVSKKDKFIKAIIDLSGIRQQVDSGSDLLNKLEILKPIIDLSQLNKKYDLVVNCCFSTQLITSFFFKEDIFPIGRIPFELGRKLGALSDLIHLKLFTEIHKILRSNSFVVHLTDTLELKEDKISGERSPSIDPVKEIIGGNWGNIYKVFEKLPDLNKDGLCLLGSILPTDIYNQYTFRTAFSLLWEFLHNNIEDRNYIVIAYIMSKQ